METWSVHHLFQKATGKLNDEQVCQIQRYAAQLISKGLPVIFSLGHLAKITKTDYSYLHDTVDRGRDASNYQIFVISKRSGGRRFIHAVSGKLLSIQQFINTEILQKLQPHPASFAFHPSGGISKCAIKHCGARWILQFDLANFFFSIPESRVYDIFYRLGYRPLLAFEMARICTTTYLPKLFKHRYCISNPRENISTDIYGGTRIPYNPQEIVGVLPQGAPTSPMLSNMAAWSLDEVLEEYAQYNGFEYRRYADDLTLSSSRLPLGKSVGSIRRDVIDIIRRSGFAENTRKIRIAGPGARKIVLGLLVDGEHPRLSKQMYARIERHLYASEKFGFVKTAAHEGFDSAYGFYNHLRGLISFVKDVDQERWEEFNPRFRCLPPLV